ncbi:hypothetical protein ACIQD3_23165 [Peribacillus loiseleuriae]
MKVRKASLEDVKSIAKVHVDFWLIRVKPQFHTNEPKILLTTILFNIAF